MGACRQEFASPPLLAVSFEMAVDSIELAWSALVEHGGKACRE